MKTSFKKVVVFFIFGIVFVYACFVFLKDYKVSGFFVDEYYFIKRSYYFRLLFQEGNLSDVRWFTNSDDSDVSQPKVGPYIYGLSFYLRGVSDVEAMVKESKFDSLEVGDKRWFEVLSGYKLSEFPVAMTEIKEILVWGRETATIFLLGAVAILFWLIAGSSLVWAFFAAVIFVTNPLTAWVGTKATTDAMQIFFFMGIFALLKIWYGLLFTYKKSGGLTIYSLFLGVAMFLATGVKTSGLMAALLVATFFVLCFIGFEGSRRRIKPVLTSVAVSFFTFFCLFWVTHPFLYRKPFEGVWDMFYERTYSYDKYWANYPATAVTSRAEAIGLIFKNTLLPGGYYANFRLGLFPIDLTLFFWGFWTLGFGVKKDLKRGNALSLTLIIWYVVAFVSMAFYMKNNWPRYYLPIVTTTGIFQAAGIYKSVFFLHGLLIRKLLK